MYLLFQEFPLDSRFLYLAAYMIPHLIVLLDISGTEAASKFLMYKSASAEVFFPSQ